MKGEIEMVNKKGVNNNKYVVPFVVTSEREIKVQGLQLGLLALLRLRHLVRQVQPTHQHLQVLINNQ